MSDYKKLIEDIKSGRKFGLSMGALVDTSPCSICGRTTAHTHKTGAVIEDGKVFYDNLDPSSVIFSFVSAPKCETCGEPMTYTRSGTDWTCQNDGCEQEGVSVTTGIGGVVGSVE